MHPCVHTHARLLQHIIAENLVPFSPILHSGHLSEKSWTSDRAYISIPFGELQHSPSIKSSKTEDMRCLFSIPKTSRSEASLLRPRRFSTKFLSWRLRSYPRFFDGENEGGVQTMIDYASKPIRRGLIADFERWLRQRVCSLSHDFLVDERCKISLALGCRFSQYQ